MHVVAVGTFDVGHAAPRRTNEWGDAYVALESVMRVHAGGGRGVARSTKWKLSGRTEKEGGEGDKRNVESKKQKGKRNKSAACEEGWTGGMGRGAILRADEKKESRRKKDGPRKLK